MDTGNKKEWISLYVNSPFIKTDCHTLGIRFTRKAAWALIREIEARLFEENKSLLRHEDTINTDRNEDMCFGVDR